MQREFKIDNHTPQEALELLGTLANNAAAGATINETRNIIAAIDSAYATIAHLIESKETNHEAGH